MDEDDGPEHVEDDTQAVQVGPEPDPTRDYTQHNHISLGGTREGRWAAQEASPLPRRWSDSRWVPNREEYFLRLDHSIPYSTEPARLRQQHLRSRVEAGQRAASLRSRPSGVF